MVRPKVVAAALLAAAVIVVLALWGRQRLEAPAAGQAGVAPDAELVATVRSEPRSFNRLVARDRTSHLVSLLTQARLVRNDLETQELELALAERWASSPDGLEYTLTLRRNVRFSDGTPMTAADVLFSAEALYDERVASPIAEPLKPAGQPLAFSAPDDHTVVVRFAVPFGPGLRVLDNLPILPKHKLCIVPLVLGGRTAAYNLSPANPSPCAPSSNRVADVKAGGLVVEWLR